MSHSSIQNSGPANTPTPATNSQNAAQMKQLLTWTGDPSAILMTVLGDIVGKENEYRQKNATMRSEAAQASTEAANVEAKAAQLGGQAEAGNEIVKATTSGASAAYGIKRNIDNSQLHKEHSTKIDAKTKEIEMAKSPRGIGNNAPEHSPDHIAKLEHERKNLMKKRDHDVKQHTRDSDHASQITQLGAGLSQAVTSINQGQTQASAAAGRNAGQLANMTADSIKGNEDTDKQVVDLATRFNPGAVAVASTRG